VTVQIGAVLLLAIIFAALVLYQVNTVPAENSALEYEHNQNVHDEMQELRNAIRNAGTTGNSQSASITLGTQYPTRTFSMNPPDPGERSRQLDLSQRYVSSRKTSRKATSTKLGFRVRA